MCPAYSSAHLFDIIRWNLVYQSVQYAMSARLLASIHSSLTPLFHRLLNSTNLTCLDPHRTSRCWRFALDWLNRRRDTPSWQVLRHSSWAERDLFIVVVVRPRIEDECREREGRKGESRLLVIFKRISRQRRHSVCEVRNDIRVHRKCSSGNKTTSVVWQGKDKRGDGAESKVHRTKVLTLTALVMT